MMARLHCQLGHGREQVAARGVAERVRLRQGAQRPQHAGRPDVRQAAILAQHPQYDLHTGTQARCCSWRCQDQDQGWPQAVLAEQSAEPTPGRTSSLSS